MYELVSSSSEARGRRESSGDRAESFQGSQPGEQGASLRPYDREAQWTLHGWQGRLVMKSRGDTSEEVWGVEWVNCESRGDVGSRRDGR